MLFNPAAAELTCCGLFEVKGAKLEFKQADQFYHVVKQRENPAPEA